MQVNLRIAETPSGQAKKPEGKPKVPIARMRSLRDLLAVGAPSAPEQEIDGGGVQSELRKPRAKYAASWIRQFGALLRRSQREVQRDRTANVIRASTNIIFASALAGTIFAPGARTHARTERGWVWQGCTRRSLWTLKRRFRNVS